MIKFTGKDSIGENVEFDFTDIGAMYADDGIVYINGDPISIASIKVKNEQVDSADAESQKCPGGVFYIEYLAQDTVRLIPRK